MGCVMATCSYLSYATPATLGGDAAIARVLVERGAQVNRRDNEGNTVLMVSPSMW